MGGFGPALFCAAVGGDVGFQGKAVAFSAEVDSLDMASGAHGALQESFAGVASLEEFGGVGHLDLVATEAALCGMTPFAILGAFQYHFDLGARCFPEVLAHVFDMAQLAACFGFLAVMADDALVHRGVLDRSFDLVADRIMTFRAAASRVQKIFVSHSDVEFADRLLRDFFMTPDA